MPYWDWTIDSQEPWKSVLFTAEYLGRNDPDRGGILLDGPFTPDAYATNSGPLRRTYRQGNMTAFYTKNGLEQIFPTNATFSQISRDFEYSAHAVVHIALGGHMAQGPEATYDLAFWLHHTFADKLFDDWQRKGQNMRKFDGQAYRVQMNSTELIMPWGTRVQDILNSTSLCYTYQDLDGGAESAASDPTVITNARNVTTADEWCRFSECDDTIKKEVDSKTTQINNDGPTITKPKSGASSQMYSLPLLFIFLVFIF